MSDRYVIDSSALLAIILGEPGDKRAAELVERGVVSTVNLSEAVAKMSEYGFDLNRTKLLLDGLGFTTSDFEKSDAYAAGKLRGVTKRAGLSFGDRACLALALREGVGVLTADRAWTNLDINVEIELIR